MTISSSSQLYLGNTLTRGHCRGASERVCCKWPAQVPSGCVPSVRLLSINILKQFVLFYLVTQIIGGLGTCA